MKTTITAETIAPKQKPKLAFAQMLAKPGVYRYDGCITYNSRFVSTGGDVFGFDVRTGELFLAEQSLWGESHDFYTLVDEEVIAKFSN